MTQRKWDAKRRYGRLLLAGVVGGLAVSAAQGEPYKLLYDLRVHGTGGKTAIVSNPGDVITMDLFAVINGQDNTSANDGFSGGFGSFLSSLGGLRGNVLGLPNVAPFTASGSAPGGQNDLDGDGDLDVGGTDPRTDTGYAFFRAFPMAENPPSEGFLVAQIQFTALSLSETPTQVNFLPRPQVGVFPIRHQIRLDGVSYGIPGQSSDILIGAPVVISATGIASGEVQYLSGSIDQHLTVNGRIEPSPGAGLSITTGLEVASGGSFTGSSIAVQNAISANSGGTIAVDSMAVGSTTAGTFTQSNGFTSTRTLTVGAAAASSGTLRQTGGTFVASSAVLGDQGSALVEQSGGRTDYTNMDLGLSPGSTATYELSQNGQFAVHNRAQIGVAGNALIRQTGGTADFDNVLLVGAADPAVASSAGRGSIEISGGILNAYIMCLGAGGDGSIIQSGGTVNIPLWLTYGPRKSQGTLQNGGSGTYVLNGGTLKARTIGTIPTGANQTTAAERASFSYIQNGGSAEFNTLQLQPIGPQGSVRAELHGGELTVLYDEYLSTKATDFVSTGEVAFVQDGGTNTTRDIYVGPGVRYQLSGGTLHVKRSMSLAGDLDFGNGTGSLVADDKSFINLSEGTIRNAANASMTAGKDSLISFPAGFDPLKVFGHFTTAGLVHVAGQPLAIPADRSVNGSGTIKGSVTNQGLLSPGNSPGIINIEGDYSQQSNGKLLIELAGVTAEEFDALSITGAASLDGLLQVNLLDDFVPAAQDRFVILSADILSGRFANADEKLALSFGTFDVLYESGRVVLTNFTAVPEPASLLLAGLALPLLQRRRR